jgi:hypothetical protein
MVEESWCLCEGTRYSKRMDVSLDGGAGLLRSMNHLFGYLGSAIIFVPHIIGGCPGVPQQSPISTALRMPLAHLPLHTYFCLALATDPAERRCL